MRDKMMHTCRVVWVRVHAWWPVNCHFVPLSTWCHRGGRWRAAEKAAEEGEERERTGTQTCLPLLLSLWWRLCSAVHRLHATTLATPSTVMSNGVAEAAVRLHRCDGV